MKDLSDLNEKLEEFNKIDISKLKGTGPGLYSFEDVYSELETAYTELKYLSSKKDILESSPYISPGNVNSLTAKINDFNQIADEILKFDPTAETSPNDIKKNIVRNVKSLTERIATDLQSLAFIVRSAEFNPADQTKELERKEEQVDNILGRLEKKEEEADTALEGIRKSSSVSGAKEFSKVFGKQSEEHRKASVKWFWASFALFILLLTYLLLLFAGDLSAATSIEVAIRESVIRVLILGVLSYALSQAVKNFSTSKHLQVVNKHRQNSLDTFELFVNAGTTEDVKSAVLLEATKSVFENGKTGYLPKTDDTSYSLSVTDVFKRLSSS